MSKKIQCQGCGKAEYDEDLYNYDGKILCRYCIVSRVCEGLIPCEYVGTCNDKTFPNKIEQIYQLKQQLAEKDKEIKSLIVDYEKRISQEQDLMSNMEHRLAEKQNTINEINREFVQAVHDWKTLCAEKDKEIAHLKEKDNYHLRYELAGADETIANLKKQLEEKDKEIEELKLKLDIRAMNLQNINTERMEAVRNQTQLAIAELEKVKDWLNEPFDEDGCFKIGGDLIDFIDQQINDLRGKKDEQI